MLFIKIVKFIILSFRLIDLPFEEDLFIHILIRLTISFIEFNFNIINS